jgi:hypothetical protein
MDEKLRAAIIYDAPLGEHIETSLQRVRGLALVSDGTIWLVEHNGVILRVRPDSDLDELRRLHNSSPSPSCASA